MVRRIALQTDKSGPSNVPPAVILKGVVEDRAWEAFISASFQKSLTAGKKYIPTPQDRNGYGEFKVKGKINPGVERYKERRIRKGAPANCQQGMQIWLTTS